MYEFKELLTDKELATFLNCSTQLIHKLKRNGEIPFINIGHLVRYNPKDVISSLEKNY